MHLPDAFLSLGVRREERRRSADRARVNGPFTVCVLSVGRHGPHRRTLRVFSWSGTWRQVVAYLDAPQIGARVNGGQHKPTRKPQDWVQKANVPNCSLCQCAAVAKGTMCCWAGIGRSLGPERRFLNDGKGQWGRAARPRCWPVPMSAVAVQMENGANPTDRSKLDGAW